MKPSLKLHSIVFGLSTAIVFALWTEITRLVNSYDLLKILIGSLISLGIYRLLASFIIYLTKKSKWVKKKFLGQYCLLFGFLQQMKWERRRMLTCNISHLYKKAGTVVGFNYARWEPLDAVVGFNYVDPGVTKYHGWFQLWLSERHRVP